MIKKLTILINVLFILSVTIVSASAGAADVFELDVTEDVARETFTILVDGSASYEFSVTKEPSHGKVSMFTPPNNITYTPDLNYNGPDVFAVKIHIEYDDAPPDDWSGVYNVTVSSVNDVPVANPLSVSTFKNNSAAVTLSGSDPVEGSSLTYAVWTFPAHGSLSDASHGQIIEQSDQTIIYTPKPGFVGSDSFGYVVFDGLDYSYEADVKITVSESNLLTVSFLGEGNGTVYSIPAGIVCVPGNSANCKISFSSGSNIDLTQTTSTNSNFGGWSGACTGTGTCKIIMDSDKTVTANYTVIPAKVRIDGQATFFYKLGNTLDLITIQGKTVRSKADTFVENVIMTSPVTILLKGGYTDDNFSSRTATSITVIKGSLKIQQGTLAVERLKIR